VKQYAVVEDGIVVNVVVDDIARDDKHVEYTDENPAYIGGSYDGYFYAQQPYSSWTKNAGNWEPPVAQPLIGKFNWNEALGEWVSVA
jgi:hypothetical protein